MNSFFRQVVQTLIGHNVGTSTYPAPARQRAISRGTRVQGRTAIAAQLQNNRAQGIQRVSRHSVGLVGYNERAYPIAKLADPHAPWVMQRVISLPQRPRYGSLTNMTAAINLGMDMLNRRPNAVREIFLVTDGKANVEVAGLPAAVRAARNAHIRIHACGMGYSFDGEQLRAIAGPTGGRVVIARDLRAVSSNLTEIGHAIVNQDRGKPSALVIAIDTSGSMNETITDGRTKLQACSEAVQHLLRWYTSNHA